MFRKLKITHKIFGIIATGMIICASYAILAVVFAQSQSNTFDMQVVPLDNLRKIQADFRELEYKMAGVQAEIVTPIAAGPHLMYTLKDVDTLWTELKDYIPDNEDKMLFEKGLQGFKGMSGKLNEAYLNEDSIDELYDEWLDYKPLILKSIDKLAAEKKGEVSTYYDESNKLILKISRVIVIISGIALCIFAIFAVLIIRTIKKPIDRVVDAAERVADGDLRHTININTEDEMGSMANSLNEMIEHIRDAFCKIISSVEQISADTEGLRDMSRELLEGAEDQRTKSEQVAVASTEMAQSIMDVAKNTSEASDATRNSNEIAETGKVKVNGAVETITRLADSVSEASKTIGGLGKSLDEIDVIVSVIQDIADQTNLLALNAAIEAARSGEHGRGFAVVADEVRKLAERTAKATSEIALKINTIQTESKASITIMEKGSALAQESVVSSREAGDSLHKIVESSDTVMDIVQSVAAATEEQSSAAEEVSQTMENITEIINHHCGLSEQLEKSATSLAKLAEGVIQQTMYFKTKGSCSSGIEAQNNNHEAKADSLKQPTI